MQDYVYAVNKSNPDAVMTLSLHRTIEGAYRAMKVDKLKEFNWWLQNYGRFRRRMKWDQHTKWRIVKTKIYD